MPEIKLSKRLRAIAALIPPGGGAADVGTDHGHIPVWLLQRGFSGALSATDINPGPLERAKKTAADNGFLDKISFHLCDGLKDIDSETTATVIIAGMGGDMIASILEAAPWTREKLLILQPMSKSGRLRNWLFHNGCRVLSESLVEDGAVYEILTATGGVDTPYKAGELLTGHFDLINASPLFPARLDAHIAKLRRAVSGLKQTADTQAAHRRAAMEKELAGLLFMRNKLT